MKIIEGSRFSEIEFLDDFLLNKLRGGRELIDPDDPDVGTEQCPANTEGCVLTGGGGGGGHVPGGCYAVAPCIVFGPPVNKEQ